MKNLKTKSVVLLIISLTTLLLSCQARDVPVYYKPIAPKCDPVVEKYRQIAVEYKTFNSGETTKRPPGFPSPTALEFKSILRCLWELEGAWRPRGV